jgi:hypothetical protein
MSAYVAIPSHTHVYRWRRHSTDIVLSSTNITLIHRARGSHRSQGTAHSRLCWRHARTGLRARFHLITLHRKKQALISHNDHNVTQVNRHTVLMPEQAKDAIA